jgi:hypothetical protein
MLHLHTLTLQKERKKERKNARATASRRKERKMERRQTGAVRVAGNACFF